MIYNNFIMYFSNINDYLMRDKQFITTKIFFFYSNCTFNNLFDILECIDLLDSKCLLQDTKNLLKNYYLGCSALRKEGIDITCATLCLWHLAEQIIDFNKENKTDLGISEILLKKYMKKIKNFYYKTIAKTIEDYRKIDPYELKKKN